MSAPDRIRCIAAIHAALSELEPADAQQVIEFFSDTRALDERINKIEMALSEDEAPKPIKYLSQPDGPPSHA